MRTSRSWKSSLPQVGNAGHSSTGDAIDSRTGRVVALSMQDIQAEPQISVPPARSALQNITLAEQCRQLTRKIAELQRDCLEQHVCETWMQRQLGHLSSMSGDLSLWVECVEAGEQLSRLGYSPGWRRSEPGQCAWIGRAPEGQSEQQRR